MVRSVPVMREDTKLVGDLTRLDRLDSRTAVMCSLWNRAVVVPTVRKETLWFASLPKDTIRPHRLALVTEAEVDSRRK